MFKRGVLLLGAGRNAVRFAPPLVISREQIDVVVDLFDQALAAVAPR
jgi:4-aminobutyrate aminotransferase